MKPLSFFGLILEPGLEYTQTVSTPFKVTMATLDVKNSTKDKDPVSVMVDCDGDGRFILCVLDTSARVLNQSIDVFFQEGSKVTFRIAGEVAVHLTGYYVDPGFEPEANCFYDEEEREAIMNGEDIMNSDGGEDEEEEEYYDSEDEDELDMDEDDYDHEDDFIDDGEIEEDEDNEESEEEDYVPVKKAHKTKSSPRIVEIISDDEESAASEKLEKDIKSEKTGEKRSKKNKKIDSDEKLNKRVKFAPASHIEEEEKENKSKEPINLQQAQQETPVKDDSKKKSKKGASHQLPPPTPIPSHSPAMMNSPSTPTVVEFPKGLKVEDIIVNSERRRARNGRKITVSYDAFVDGKPVTKGGEKTTSLRAGCGGSLIAKAVEGMTLGGERTVFVPAALAKEDSNSLNLPTSDYTLKLKAIEIQK